MKKSRVELREIAIKEEKAVSISGGPLVVDTGEHTGRSPNAKFIVIDNITSDTVDWRNVQGMNEKVWNEFKSDFFDSKSGSKLYEQSVHAGHKDFSGLKIKIYTELAWHSIFALNMFEEIGEQMSMISDFIMFRLLRMSPV